jgi:hypothetical protein
MEMLADIRTNQAMADANQKEMTEDYNEKFEVLQGSLVSRKDMHQEKMDAWWITNMRDDQKERTARQEATEANPERMESNPEMMQSIEYGRSGRDNQCARKVARE